MIPENSLSIDEEGYPLFGELRVQDPAVGAQILSQIEFAENGAFQTQVGTQMALVEAFDEPLIAQSLEEPAEGFDKWRANFLFDVHFHFDLDSLTLDQWDRFHGVTDKGIPFVLSRKAQAAFFDQLDEFDDDSITYNEKQIPVHPWQSSNPEIRFENYWSKIYQTEEPGWEMNRVAPAFEDMLPRLKIPKARILVLGAGSGNDAAFFADHGHVITAVDFSPEAIARGKEKYGHLKNLTFVEKDVFNLDSSWTHQFDYVVEHTCFCAIPPERRDELINVWRRVLVPGGQLLAVFFTMERRTGPPFGATEWELRERLKNHFQFQFWGRWKKSMGRRQGKELFVFATKK